MKKTLLSVIAVLVLLIPAVVSAQDVPDLSKGWKLADELNVTFDATMPDGTLAPVQALARYFVNESTSLMASVLMWHGTEVAMIFQDDAKNVWMAVKVGNKWHRAKESGFVLKAIIVLDKDTTGVKLSMDTIDGVKELYLPL